MTTHYASHAPHTPPLWRRVISLPKTGWGWAAIVLGGPLSAPLVLGIVSNVLPRAGILDSDPPGFLMLLGIASVFAGLAGGFVAAIELVGDHERSWLVWLALVPMLLFYSFLIWPLTKLLNAGAVVTYSLSFLIWVLIVAGITFWISRVNSQES